jgi:hypothetical protein
LIFSLACLPGAYQAALNDLSAYLGVGGSGDWTKIVMFISIALLVVGTALLIFGYVFRSGRDLGTATCRAI